MTRLLRSTAFRIALIFAVTLTATTYLVFAFVYWRFDAANIVLVRSVLRDEIRLAADWPAERLRKQLALRLTQDIRHLDYVGLFDKAGTQIFGNVPPGLSIPADGQAQHLRAPPPGPAPWQSEDAIFVATRRSDGGTLVLGRSLIYVDELEAAMRTAFVTAIVPVVVIALAIGSLVSRRASRRLTTIQDAIRGVMAGDLDVRLPARGTPDDVDELVRAVNLMLDEIVRLLQQLKSVGDNIAHDLRAPLAVMRARLERGLTGPSEPDLRQVVAAALGDLERAMTTVTALLRISELESGLRRAAFDRVDFVAVCRDAFDLYEALGEAKGLTVEFRVEQPVFVVGDGDLLREAIANLMDNAVKFTPRAGAVTVECGVGDALVRIADTGPGIPAEEREKVVKRFYRAPSTRNAPGHGLGLSMAKTIIDMHGFGLNISGGTAGAIFEVTTEPKSVPSSKPRGLPQSASPARPLYAQPET